MTEKRKRCDLDDVLLDRKLSVSADDEVDRVATPSGDVHDFRRPAFQGQGRQRHPPDDIPRRRRRLRGRRVGGVAWNSVVAASAVERRSAERSRT